MNTGLSLKSLKLNTPLAKLAKRYGKHIGFAVAIIVLLTYVVVVMKIDSLSKTQPSPTATTQSLVPHVNQQAIKRIQALENNSPQIHSLFEKARTNPFQE